MRPVLAVLAAMAILAPPAAAQNPKQTGGPGARSRPITDPLQPTALPALPRGMTLEQIREGDALFHGRAGCFACHGADGEGLPAAGDALTLALAYVPYRWASIDSLVALGIPDALTRTPIAMPRRGARGDLSDAEIARVSAYVWAISQTQGEPWPGGHPSHAAMVPPGSTSGTARHRPQNLPRSGLEPTRRPSGPERDRR